MDELFPVTTVGSWPRSARLRRALRQRQAGEISGEEFDAVADEAVLDALQHQEAAGVDIVTDGEQRRDNFYSFVVGKIDGMRLMPVSELLDYLPDRARFEETLRALDVPAFAIKSPVAVDKLRLRSGLAQDEVAFLQRHTQRPIKVPLPGPYLLTRSAWIEQLSGDAYATQEDLAVANPRTDEVEDAQTIQGLVEQFLEFFDPEKIFLNPDCGFGTFAERSVNTPETASAKLRAISWAAQLLRDRHGHEV